MKTIFNYSVPHTLTMLLTTLFSIVLLNFGSAIADPRGVGGGVGSRDGGGFPVEEGKAVVGGELEVEEEGIRQELVEAPYS
jgi:hypothetical protein